MRHIRQMIVEQVEKLGQSGLSRCTVQVFTPCGSRGVTYTKDDDWGATLLGSDQRAQHELPVIRKNESYRIRIVPKIDGYLSLFNLGTSGSVDKLFPNSNEVENRVVSGVEFVVKNDSAEHRWHEGGPLTADHGLTEILLFIITETKREVKLSDLHIDLLGTAFGSRGSLGKESDGIASIYSESGIHMDLMEFEVK
jgi:hypothetical protein